MLQNFVDTASKKIQKMFFVLLILIIILKWFTTIESWFVWIRYTLWNISNMELDPWINFKIPFVQSIKKVNVKVKTINYMWDWSVYKNNYSWVNESEFEWIMNKPSISVLDIRWLPIKIELTVLYQLKSEKASETIVKYWRSWDEKIINPTVREVVRDVLWVYEAEIVPEKRWEIAVKIKSQLLAKMSERPEVILNDVQLRGIELPSQVQEKILQVQMAKQDAAKQKYELEKAKIEALTKRARSEWIANAQIEEARWSAESEILKAQADAKAIELRYNAESEWYAKLNKTVNDRIVKLKMIDKWTWQVPKIQWSNGNILQFPADISK